MKCVHIFFSLVLLFFPTKLVYILGTFAYAGGQFGTVITMPIAGVLATSKFGWPSIFYIFGALAIIWSVAFFYYGADAPSDHRSISQEEKMYIEESLRTKAKNDEEVTQVKIHYKSIINLNDVTNNLVLHIIFAVFLSTIICIIR